MGSGRLIGIDETGSFGEHKFCLVVAVESQNPGDGTRRHNLPKKRRGALIRAEEPERDFRFIHLKPEMEDWVNGHAIGLQEVARAHLLIQLGFDPTSEKAFIDAYRNPSAFARGIKDVLYGEYGGIPRGSVICRRNADNQYPIVRRAHERGYGLLDSYEFFSSLCVPFGREHFERLSLGANGGSHKKPEYVNIPPSRRGIVRPYG